MTIIVMGHIRFGAGEIDRLHAPLSAMIAATNAEPGCDHYSYARHVDDPDTMVISERWASEEALAAHSASEHMAAFTKTIGGAKVLGISVKAWNGDYWRTLIGD